ncbi:MAG: M4 family metallopeptidase, partial [Bacteroidota bacterium]
PVSPTAEDRGQNDPNATYYPNGELAIAPESGDLSSENYRFSWKFNIYADDPLSRAEIFVDAKTGNIVWSREEIHHVDSTGSAVTMFSGTQTIITDYTGTNFRLRESGRGNGINTYDMNEGTNYGAAVDFVDGNNVWNNVNAQQDEAATDGHWGAEMTYDYFFLEHNRNSINGSGFALNSYVHYDANFVNAFWDGQRMTYGDGNGGSWDPFTCLDIAGHEITHGMTQFTADLIYQNESGALNESFSDIFGKAIEFYARPNNFSWRVGIDISNNGIRDMDNPNLFNDPDTYGGTNYYTGAADNGGVHINSGIQNKWFNILVDGESGTNDNNNFYNVSSIGWVKAGAVAFRNLSVYLTPGSQHTDARFYAIQSAVDLYGPCTSEVIAVTDAWYAVGVGPPFVFGITANFNIPSTSYCNLPATIPFTNTSTNGGSYYWDFGDGTIDTTNLNPTHVYSTPGQYTVTLIAYGGPCGNDTLVQTNYIDVTPPAAPTALDVSRCGPGPVTVTATGTGSMEWYNAPTGGFFLGSGASYTAPWVGSSTIYYVEQLIQGAPQFGGPNNPGNVGGGGYHNNGSTQYLEFSTFETVLFKTAYVDPGGNGNRTIQLWDANGGFIR